jgi:hypothetical protein
MEDGSGDGGVDITGTVRWGTRVCQFCKTRQYLAGICAC